MIDGCLLGWDGVERYRLVRARTGRSPRSCWFQTQVSSHRPISLCSFVPVFVSTHGASFPSHLSFPCLVRWFRVVLASHLSISGMEHFISFRGRASVPSPSPSTDVSSIPRGSFVHPWPWKNGQPPIVVGSPHGVCLSHPLRPRVGMGRGRGFERIRGTSTEGSAGKPPRRWQSDGCGSLHRSIRSRTGWTGCAVGALLKVPLVNHVGRGRSHTDAQQAVDPLDLDDRHTYRPWSKSLSSPRPRS